MKIPRTFWVSLGQLTVALLALALFVWLLLRGVQVKWLALSVNTAALLGFLVYEFRFLWRFIWFWSAMIALLAIHLFIFIVVLRGRSISGLFYMGVIPIEWALAVLGVNSFQRWMVSWNTERRPPRKSRND